jgi:hypothetical protein
MYGCSWEDVEGSGHDVFQDTAWYLLGENPLIFWSEQVSSVRGRNLHCSFTV